MQFFFYGTVLFCLLSKFIIPRERQNTHERQTPTNKTEMKNGKCCHHSNVNCRQRKH